MMVGSIRTQANAAAEMIILSNNDGKVRLIRVCQAGKEVPGVVLGVGMRNAQRCGRNFTGTDKGDQVGDIVGSIGSQDQASRFQYWPGHGWKYGIMA